MAVSICCFASALKPVQWGSELRLSLHTKPALEAVPCKAEDRTSCPPEYWRTRADKIRAIADEMFDPQSRETLVRIVKEYESLAKRAEERQAAIA